MQKRAATIGLSSVAVAAAMLLATALLDSAFAEGIENRTIGYVLTSKAWAVYQTPDGKAECPEGLNDGPREQFSKLFPNDGKKRTLLDTQLYREGDVWYPTDKEPSTTNGPLRYLYATGKTAIGLNLDGKIGPHDFTSPEGVPGVDNQLFRAVGCVAGFRGPQGPNYYFENEYMRRYNFNRVLIEITNVDNLVNDKEVTVTTYRGLDPLLTSADGKTFIPGGTQRADERWGQRYIQRVKGKIVDGVLTTEPTDLKFPWAMTFDTNPDQSFKAARFQLKLNPIGAVGLLGGYVPVDDWAHRMQINWSTHHASYGQMSTASIIRALREVADAYPDPITGKNTAVSAAAEMEFTQAYVVHSEDRDQAHAPKQVASSK